MLEVGRQGFPWGLAEGQDCGFLKESQGGVRAMAIAISRPELKQLTDIELMGHLFRRAGFGATREQIEAAVEQGYEATVEHLLHPEAAPPLEEDLIFRYYPDMKEARQIDPAQSLWVYRMISSLLRLPQRGGGCNLTVFETFLYP